VVVVVVSFLGDRRFTERCRARYVRCPPGTIPG
jgi:hypothetical protein